MDREITDLIYYRTVKEKSAEVELAVYTVYSMVEKELFYRGFTEGIRFLLELM